MALFDGEPQLRGMDKEGRDTGELETPASIEEALAKFLTEPHWKLSFTLGGDRFRLVRMDDLTKIQVTKWSEDKVAYVPFKPV